MSKILFLKLSTGDEVLADIIEIDGSPTLTMKNPIKLLIIPGQGIAMLPLIPTTPESSVMIDESDIVYSHEVSESLLTEYKSSFLSKVITPPDKKLIRV
jgi:hypothetical protein